MNTIIRRIVPIVAISFVLGACASTGKQQSTGEYIDDVALTAKVKSALIEDSDTKARNIQVDVFKGVVQLSGFVDSSTERAEAERVTREIAGVQRVENRLSVR